MNTKARQPTAPSFFTSHWNGQRPLWSAFWLVGVLGMNVMGLWLWLMTIIIETIPQIERSWTRVAVLLCELAYVIFAAVCVWRCAKNSSSPRKGWLERVMVAPLVAVIGFPLIGTVVGKVTPEVLTGVMNALTSLPVSWHVIYMVTIYLAAIWIYWDATGNKIGRVPEGAGVLNMSAGMWSVGAMLFWFFFLPAYLIKRRSLVKLSKTQPIEVKGRWGKLAALCLLGAVLTLAVLSSG